MSGFIVFKCVINVNVLFSVVISEYHCKMSDLNIAFISGDDNDAEVLSSTKFIEHCNEKHDQGFMMTAHSLSKPSTDGENSVRECVWETCCTVPAKPINSHVSKRRNKGQHTNHTKQHSGARSKNKRSAQNKKKTKSCLAEKLNGDYTPLETDAVQAQDVSVPSDVCITTCGRKACVENVDFATELLARVGQNSCTQQVTIGACLDADASVNLLQTGLLSTAVGHIDMACLPDKNIVTEYLDENKNTSSDMICERDCQVKMKLPMTNATPCQDSCDLSLSNTVNTDHCSMSDIISFPTAECLKLDASQFIHETPDSDTAECFTCISEHVQTANQCVLEDDLDDIAALTVFNKRSSRRLRRTSIEIYRKSLHDEGEEECDTIPVTVNTECDTAVADVEMHSVSDSSFCNEPTDLLSKSDDSQTYSINSNSVVQPKTGIVACVIYCYYVLYFLSSFYARQHICYSAYMLWQFRLSVCLSVRLSVCHTGGSVKNG